MPQRNLAVIFLAAVISLACYQRAPHNRYVRTLANAMEVVSKHYVQEVDERALFESAMDGMLSDLDPYSTFISPDSFNQFQESLDQEFGGIGIVVEGPPNSERLTVVSPLVGTPAYRAGMRSGDVILEIDGVSTEGMTLAESVKLMRGPRGKAVHLVVRHPDGGTLETLDLNREIIPIESVLGDSRNEDRQWVYRLEENPRIGYIRLTTFGEHSVDELRDALQLEPPVDALILDLRGNAGGLLGAAVATCDLFIDSGTIVSTRGRNGAERRRYDATSDLALPTDVPMAVLINRGSASASEIVAACLKDHDRAIVVGQRSWGKGSVQNIIELEGGRSALKLTTASYWRPSGRNIHRVKDAKDEDEWGVRPSEGFDIKLTDDELTKLLEARRDRDIVHMPGEATVDAKTVDTATTHDSQLRRAVEYLEEQIK